jgi:hypothetical protein
MALFGACRARHCACDALPALRREDRTRARCLALFSSDEKVPGTAPIASLGARARLFNPRGRPPAPHRRGRSPSIHPRATAPMGRRWDARGTSRGGPEGRPPGTPRNADRSPPPGKPHCLADTRHPPAARLMGRRDARPHNPDQKAGAPGHHEPRTASLHAPLPRGHATPSRSGTDGQAGRPPPQSGPKGRCSGMPRFGPVWVTMGRHPVNGRS